MKHLLMVTALVVACLGAWGAQVLADSPTAVEKLTQDTREAVQAVKGYSAQQKAAFQSKAQAELAAIQQQMTILQSKVTEASAASRTELQASIAELDKKKDAARNKLDELRSATDAKWMQVRSGVNSALEDLKRSYHKALSSLQ